MTIKTSLYRVKMAVDAEAAPRDRRPAARERLLETAGRLFYRHGFQAVGIDRILAESGVAKMTLYRHFPSKDDLVAAYLERVHEEFWRWAEAAMAKARGPADQLVAFFDAAGRLARSPECLGCAFQGAALAFPERDHPAHRRAVLHKLSLRDRFARLARKAGLRAPDALASQLLLLTDGAWVAARVFGPRDSPAAQLKDAAAALIEAHRARGHARPARRSSR